MRTQTILAILGVALSAALLTGPAALAQMPPNPPVVVATPLVDQVASYDVYTGRFTAKQAVELRARVSGYLAEQRFVDGALVDAGDVLFVIDQRPFQTALRRAEAALAAATAAAELASIELDRATQLADRAVGTAQEVDRTQAELSQTQAEVKVAEADVAAAQLDLEFTTITAPFAGRISAGEVDVGNLVVGGTTGTTMLATVVSIAPIDFVFTASEADFLRYARNIALEDRPSGSGNRMRAAIKLLDEDSFTHEAYIDFVDNQLDPNSGTIEVRAVVEEPDPTVLVPGVFGRIQVTATPPTETLLVPDDAVLSDQAVKIVLTVQDVNGEGVGTVVPVPVELGALHRGLRAITGGELTADMKVITAGVMRAQPGSTVTPQDKPLAFQD
ncbi:MAG: efflux RND transporter periplasmic adaptor subunit [Pseudomonadota bacterium]